MLADGVQTAFAAGAVAELAATGLTWSAGRGAGLGAQVAALALLGQAQEARERWRYQAEHGCPLLRSSLSFAQELLAERADVALLADPWRLEGWLDPVSLAEHMKPERAGLGPRLARAGARLEVAVEELGAGVAAWRQIAREEDSCLLEAAARFPGGWGAFVRERGRGCGALSGGVEAIPSEELVPADSAFPWDIVCGFPVPPVERPGLSQVLFETIQRRAEVRAAHAVFAELAAGQQGGLTLVAPTPESYRRILARDTAELGVEYPLPWERNGELAALLLSYGQRVAQEVLR